MIFDNTEFHFLKSILQTALMLLPNPKLCTKPSTVPKLLFPSSCWSGVIMFQSHIFHHNTWDNPGRILFWRRHLCSHWRRLFCTLTYPFASIKHSSHGLQVPGERGVLL